MDIAPTATLRLPTANPTIIKEVSKRTSANTPVIDEPHETDRLRTFNRS